MYKIIGADHKEYGPSSAEEIRAWIKEGRADGRTLARAEDSTEWRPLANFPDFADITTPSAPPPPFPAGSSGTPYPGALPGTDSASGPDMDIGRCLAGGLKLLTGNFGLLAGASILAGLLDFGITYISAWASLSFIAIFFKGVIYGGLCTVYLARLRNQPVGIGGTFAGFGPSFVHLLLAGFLTQFLAGLGFCFCVIPWIYLKIAWIFTMAIIADQRLEFWSAMEHGRKVVTRNWFKVFCLAVVVFIPFIISRMVETSRTMELLQPVLQKWASTLQPGVPPNFEQIWPQIVAIAEKIRPFALASEVVYLINLPFAMGALMYAYQSLFGSRPARSA